jgi:hypothetical protein
MRALGDRRRKAPIEPAKEESPKTETPVVEETKQTDEFDQSVTIS